MNRAGPVLAMLSASCLLVAMPSLAQDGGVPDAQEPALPAQALVASGLAKLRRGDIEAAVAQLRTASAGKPTSAAIATDLGFALGKLGRAREAESYLRKAIELDPRRFYAYGNLADLLADSPERFGRAEEVIALLGRGLAQTSDNPRAQASLTLSLANFQRSIGRLTEARALLVPILPLTDSAGQRARELQAAVAVDEAALAFDDWPSPTLSFADERALAEAFRTFREGKTSKALEQAETLIAGKPGWAKARLLRSKALESLGRHDQAVAELSLLLQFHPSEAEAWRLLGVILAKHGGALEAGRAEEAIRHALVLEPMWDDLRTLRAEVAERRRQNQGESNLDETAPPSRKARDLLDEAQRWLDQDAPEMADVLLAQALADSPQFVEAAAASYARSGKVPEATLKAVWDHGDALARLALALLAARNDVATLAQVKPWLEHAVVRGAREARFARALVRSREGDRTGALADLQVYVTAYASPAHLDQARMLRASLLSRDARGDAALREARRLLLADRPEAAERVLGGPCRAGLASESLIELGRVREYMRDPQRAIDCHKLAADAAADGGGALPALTRLSYVAAALPAQALAGVEPYLRRARRASIPAAAWALSKLEDSRGHTQDALALARAFLDEAASDDILREPARQFVAATESASERQRQQDARRRGNVAIAAAIALTLGILLWLRARFRGYPVAKALARKPDLYPELARAVAEIRHDLLKHRASVLGMAGTEGASRDDMLRSFREPVPLAAAVADLYAGLGDRARALGLTLRPLAREPVFGELHRDLREAEGLLAGAADPASLHALDRALREQHAPRLAGLLAVGPRTVLEPSRLAAWIRAVEAEVTGAPTNKTWTAPAILVADLDLAVPVAELALAAVLANLLRNAVQAVAERADKRVLVRVEHERDVTGRRMVSLLVADTCPLVPTLDDIEKRDGQRGLGIVRDLVRRWGGHLIVRHEQAPMVKSIGASFPAIEVKT